MSNIWYGSRLVGQPSSEVTPVLDFRYLLMRFMLFGIFRTPSNFSNLAIENLFIFSMPLQEIHLSNFPSQYVTKLISVFKVLKSTNISFRLKCRISLFCRIQSFIAVSSELEHYCYCGSLVLVELYSIS